MQLTNNDAVRPHDMAWKQAVKTKWESMWLPERKVESSTQNSHGNKRFIE